MKEYIYVLRDKKGRWVSISTEVPKDMVTMPIPDNRMSDEERVENDKAFGLFIKTNRL